jgi:hypothetical protein
MKVYGLTTRYTQHGSFETQNRAIKEYDPLALIVGATFNQRVKNAHLEEIDTLLSLMEKGDRLILTRIEKLSDNTDEALDLYRTFVEKEMNVCFTDTPWFDSEKCLSMLEVLKKNIRGIDFDFFYKNIYSILLRDYLDIAYEKKKKDELRKKNQIDQKRLNKEQLGRKKGQIFLTSKFYRYRDEIESLSKTFDGTLSDIEVMKRTKLSNNTYYRYKSIIKEQRTKRLENGRLGNEI